MKVIFVAYIRTHFVALLPHAEWLRSQGHRVAFYFAQTYNGFLEDAAALKQLGIGGIEKGGGEIGTSERSLWRGRREPVSVPSRSFASCAFAFRDVDRFYQALLVRLAPHLLVLPEENVSYLSNLLVRQAHVHSIPTVIMPYTIDNPVEAAEAYYLRRRFLVRPGLRVMFARKYPQWVFEHKGASVLRLPFRAAATMQWMGFAPPDPWKNTCSFADAVAVECKALSRLHVRAGLPLSKLHIIGSSTLDRMAAIQREAETLKARLLQDLGLPVDKPVFLAAIPPDQFNTVRPGCEFTHHAEVLAFWMNTLAATGWNVIVNLHPHLNPHQVQLGDHPNVRLCVRPVAELLPLCDVFVACISATIRWAIAAAKPVLNHDFYRYGYDDYRSVPGVVHMNTRAEFSHEVAQFAASESHRENLRRSQAEVAADWGSLDEKGGQRLLELFNLLGRHRKPT
ncbi:MAG: hypothetical protein QE570_19550 [Verrucomicrobiota bacterium]|nr:hypothetical protein [Verrucomicrobiota bacterium]